MSVETSSPPEQGQLRANTIGLPGVLFQSITTMAPASAVSFSLGAAIPFTGSALPLAVIIALVVCCFIALSIGSLARHLPSAGGYFTYVSESIGFHVGWLTGWMFDLAYLLIVPFQLLVLGPVADSFVSSTFHLSLGWGVWAVIFAVIVFALTFFGIKLSADTGIVLGVIEIVVFTLLSIWLIATSNNNTLAVFNPASSLQSGLGGWQGVFFGMIFVLLAFAGFESSAPLAEEAKNPRRTVPRAIFLAALSIGIFYVFCSYAGVVGWGPAKIGTYGADSDPWGTMATRVWGPFHIIVILAILNSALGNANAGVNAASRMLYAMGRTRSLPPILAHLNKSSVPDVAIIFAMIVAVIFSLWPGFAYGPTTGFAFLGTVLTLPIILVYLATCVSVPFFYLRKHREEFNVLRHIVVPGIPFIILLFVLYFQFSPLPAAPLNLAGPIVGVWLVIGLIVIAVLSRRSPDALKASSKIYIEDAEV
ncbi:APC family permease [Dictyobacter kobayashii]|uniref:Putative amino acid permease family protein n=1 Tax=Dictyobacter kobayashii TaxID=2014872 RepID=A0A402AIW0_9CHLR|nr:amino acid permease [Dictyobacter kobayashii]GCE19003.1 putative amino acid permease family protein [Dictyobacter kobayashii]